MGTIIDHRQAPPFAVERAGELTDKKRGKTLSLFERRQSNTVRKTAPAYVPVVTLLALGLLPTLACATGIGMDGNTDTLTIVLNGLIHLLTDTYARLFMVIGIAGVGYLWMWKGTVPAGRAIGTIIGIGIVFSASFICTKLGIGGF